MMKKLLSFFTAALLSVSMFASVDVVPTDQVLADYYEKGQLCVCVYFEGPVCNDIVWAGTYNGWATDDPTTMAKFEEVDGYEGWYVVAVDDATDPSSGDGICGKPVQLKSDGSFAWDYQTGNAKSWTLIRGSVNIIAGYSGEADLKGWSTAQPNVLVSAYWKNQGSPCIVIPTHQYTIQLNAPHCADAEGNYFEPAIIGTFNSWAEGVAMNWNEETFMWEYTINDEEGHEFKFKAAGDTDWSNQISIQDKSGNWIDNLNIKLPVATQDTTLEIDYSEGKYTLCVADCDSADYTITVVVPVCENTIPQVLGSFNNWSDPVAMTATSNKNEYTATIHALCTDVFKFNDAVLGWYNEIKKWNGTEWKGLDNISFGKETTISLDYSDIATYCWSACQGLVTDYTITLSASPTQGGSVSGAGTYIEGSVVTIEASANTGYHFSQWSDGNTDNPRSFVATQDTSFTAIFEENSSTTIPNNQTLQSYAEVGQNLVYAIYVDDDIKCNDLVLVGTYNGWVGDAASCSKFVAVDGFDGWYVCCVTDASESIEAKPVQLDGAGAFNWDYQVGKLEQEAVVRGTATIVPGFSNECDIKAIDDSAPLLIQVNSWKNDPCAAVYHDYVITLVSPDCNEEDFVVPAISGGFNDWAQQAMELDNDATYARQLDGLPGAVFTVTAHAAEGTQYKFRSSEEWGKDWTNELKQFNTETSEWEVFNGGDNFTLGADTILTYDLGDPSLYSWSSCEKPLEEDSMDYVFTVIFPECEYVVPQIIGSFDGWDGTNMTATTNPNEYTIELRALPSSEYKFRDGVKGWNNELQTFDGEEWKNFDNMKFGTEATINLDYSDVATYQWAVCEPDFYTLTLTSADPTLGYVIGGGEFQPNEVVSFAAVCTDESYVFSQWSDGKKAAGRTVTMNSDITLTAYFAQSVVDTIYVQTIEVNSMNPLMGSVMVQLLAVPESGYKFTNWDDLDTSNPRTIELTDEPQSFTAAFDIATSQQEVAGQSDDHKKVIKNNQLLIIHDGKTHNAQGAEVK